MKAALDKAADRYLADIRSLLREKKVIYSGIARDGQTVVVRFRDANERARAYKEISDASPDLLVREAESGGELRLVASLKPEAQKRIQDGAVQQNITILRNRVNELAVSEPIIAQQGADRVVVQLPGVQDTARAKDILGRTATLEIRMVDEDPGALEAAVTSGTIPVGTDLYRDRNGSPSLIRRQVVLTGDRIQDAQPGFDSRNGEAIVSVTLDSAGGRIMRDISRENVGKGMGVLLIDKDKTELITAPKIREELGSRFQISGGRMSPRESNDIALLMRAGALAAPMEIIEERTVGPSLGKENIEKGFDSVKYGFIVLAAFICVYYLLMGVISTISLGVNLLLLVAVLSMLQATLTLPGIAAVAIQAGYERAWNTILDSNVTTLIAGLALLIFGSGPVRGFAIVHCLGILTSMFSAVFVSRGLVAIVYGGRKKLDKISIGQVWKPAT
jgi:preprotein translocase subunit SecD